ncbi:SAM-dependent methyltransferase, partial [Pseudomonas prosekii]
MLSILKKLTGQSPAPAAVPVQVAPPVAPPAVEKVDPYMLGLHDAMLSGWFNQATGEL